MTAAVREERGGATEGQEAQLALIGRLARGAPTNRVVLNKSLASMAGVHFGRWVTDRLVFSEGFIRVSLVIRQRL